MDGSIAYVANRVFVWNLGTGKTTQVSGRQADGGRGVQLAIAGARVAWLSQWGNEESDQDLYASSLSARRRDMFGRGALGQSVRRARAVTAGLCRTWLGGVVGSGKRILVNRWTRTTGAISNAGLYALKVTTLEPVARGSETVQAVAADSRRAAVLQWRWLPNEKTIHVYSATGSPGQHDVSRRPEGSPSAAATSSYSPTTGSSSTTTRGGTLGKIFTPHGSPNQQVLAVHGNIAVYSTPVHYSGSRPMSGRDPRPEPLDR